MFQDLTGVPADQLTYPCRKFPQAMRSMKNIRFIGLDVHAETIGEPNAEVRSLGTIPNREESIRRLIRKLGPAAHLHACCN